MNLEEIRNKAFEDAKKGLKKSFAKKDAQVIQAVSAYDEIEKDVNVLVERLREWYSLHFPEMDKKIKDHEKYAEFAFYGNRAEIEDKNLQKLAKASVGANLEENDYKIIKRFTARILELYKLRDVLNKYIEKRMKEIAPNVESLAGGSIGARLIKSAGGLENMAKMPSSTIQVLGAEKALFRHLKTKAKGPKYGYIFQCPSIHNAQKDRRGRIARALASKLAIAARMDFYNGKLDSSLKTKFEKAIRPPKTGKKKK